MAQSGQRAFIHDGHEVRKKGLISRFVKVILFFLSLRATKTGAKIFFLRQAKCQRVA